MKKWVVKNFLADFTFKAKMGSKVKILLVKSLITKSTKSCVQRVQISNHFLKRILPSYGQTLITEHQKTGHENFSCEFSIHNTKSTKFTVKSLENGS